VFVFAEFALECADFVLVVVFDVVKASLEFEKGPLDCSEFLELFVDL